MQRKSALYLAGGLLLVGIVEPTWSWMVGQFWDQAASDPGRIIGGVSWALAFLAPYQAYFIGAGVGVSLGLVLAGEKRRRPKANPLYELGQRAVWKANHIEQWLDNPFLYKDYPRYFAEVHALILDFHKLGFEVPDPPREADAATQLALVRHYFLVVGNLLTSGHNAEALTVAKQLSDEATTQWRRFVPADHPM